MLPKHKINEHQGPIPRNLSYKLQVYRHRNFVMLFCEVITHKTD